jgi:predicted porin
MKKTLIALAAIAATSAFAQSTVTLYGVLDAGVTNAASTTKFTSGVNGTPRIGFKGEEDLGGGLKAIFQVETGFNGGKEAATSFGDRGAFVGVASNLGTVTLGSSILSPSFFARAGTDPSTTNNYSIVTYAGAARLDNSIHYTSPTMSGVTVRAAFVMKDDNGGTNGASDIAATYSNGPLTLAASATDNGLNEGKGSFVGAAYDLGVVKLFANSVKAPGTAAVAAAAAVAAVPGNAGTAAVAAKAAVTGLTYTSFGVSAPIGAFVLQADFRQTKDASADMYVLSAQYALSKRTSLTAYTSKMESADSTVGAGIRHNF